MLWVKPGLPFSWAEKGRSVIVTRVQSNQTLIQPGDVLLSVDHFPVQRGREMEFSLDGKRSGDTVVLTVRRAGGELDLPIVTHNWYTRTFVLSNFILSFFMWAIGNAVLFKKPGDKTARVLYCLAQSLTVSIGIAAAHLPAGQRPWIFFLPCCYYLVYPVFPALLLHFTLVFPKEKKIVSHRMAQNVLPYLPAVVFVPLLLISHLHAMVAHQPESYRMFFRVYTCHRAYVLVYFLMSVSVLLHSYFRAEYKSDKNKIRWIFWGMAMGGLPFMLFWTLPQILGKSPLLPEDLVNLVLLLVPFSFAIAIVKYQAFDIEVLIRRSLVYFSLTGLIAGLYLLMVGWVGNVLWESNPQINHLMVIAFTLVAAILFNPAKQKMQIFVDKTFYRVKYNYKLATKTFGLSLASAVSPSQVVDLLIEKADQTLQVEKAAVLVLRNGVWVPEWIRGFSPGENSLFCFEEYGDLIRQIHSHNLPAVKRGRVNSNAVVYFPPNFILEKSGIELILPIGQASKKTGVLALGRKLSGARYSEDDLELLSALLLETSNALQRIRYQESAVQERTKSERFEKLNRLKSDFVSHVSHELRTPLTSILTYLQNLIDGIPEHPTPQVKDVLNRIHDSSRYLNRMICNLLDVTKIEAERLNLHPEKISLPMIITKTVQTMSPIASEKNICLQSKFTDDLGCFADSDAFQQILYNLLENAIKYSPKGSVIIINAKKISGGSESNRSKKATVRVAVSVCDEGIGIPKEKLQTVFDRFERVASPGTAREKGLGLGLYIAKTLVEAQNGTIRVESRPGKGSVFTVEMPGC